MTTENPNTEAIAVRIVESILQRLPLEQLLSGTTAPIKGDAVGIGQKFGELYQGVLERVRAVTDSNLTGNRSGSGNGNGNGNGMGNGQTSEALADASTVSLWRRPRTSPPTDA